MKAHSTRTGRRAPVMEVFASIQGEGRYVGEPQVFLRLRGCPLRCRWCDTPGSWNPDAGRDWAGPAEVARRIAAVEPGPPRTVSVTGGEPLLWPEFLLGLRDRLAPRRMHLETAGAHPLALERVRDAFDHVSLDLKHAVDLDEPQWPDPRLGHAEPLPRTEEDWGRLRSLTLPLLRGRDACAKLIVAGGRRPEEYQPILDDVLRLAPGLPLFVQPVTPMGGVPAPGRAVVEGVVEAALARGLAVRVVPQVHRLLRVP